MTKGGEQNRSNLADCVSAFECNPTLENAAFLKIAFCENKKVTPGKEFPAEDHNQFQRNELISKNFANRVHELRYYDTFRNTTLMEIAIFKEERDLAYKHLPLDDYNAQNREVRTRKYLADRVSAFEDNQSIENAAFIKIAQYEIDNYPDGPEARINCDFSNRLTAFGSNPSRVRAALLQVSLYQMKWDYDDTNEFGHEELLESINIWKELDRYIDDICLKYLGDEDYKIFYDFKKSINNLENKLKSTYADAALLQIALSQMKWDNDEPHELEHKVLIESKAARKIFDEILKNICLTFLTDREYYKNEGKRNKRICLNLLKDEDFTGAKTREKAERQVERARDYAERKDERDRKRAKEKAERKVERDLVASQERGRRKKAVQAHMNAGFTLQAACEKVRTDMSTRVSVEALKASYYFKE